MIIPGSFFCSVLREAASTPHLYPLAFTHHCISTFFIIIFIASFQVCKSIPERCILYLFPFGRFFKITYIYNLIIVNLLTSTCFISSMLMEDNFQKTGSSIRILLKVWREVLNLRILSSARQDCTNQKADSITKVRRSSNMYHHNNINLKVM